MKILDDPDYRKFILILTGVFVSGVLAGALLIPAGTVHKPETVTIHDTVIVKQYVADSSAIDSLVWEVEKRDDKLIYNHNLIAKLIDEKNQQALKIDSVSKSDIYEWIRARQNGVY